MNTGKIKIRHSKNLHSLKEDWSEIKEHLKTQYPRLVDKDLKYREGHEDELISTPQNR